MKTRFLSPLLFCVCVAAGCPSVLGRPSAEIAGDFVGTTPCAPEIRQLLGIPPDVPAEIIEWKLTLHRGRSSTQPGEYALEVEYGPTTPNLPGLGRVRHAINRHGTWRVTNFGDTTAARLTLELTGALRLAGISADVLHVLNADGTLMVGDSGWSYTLNRRMEPDGTKPIDLPSRTVPPLASGKSVFAVYEGRTPGSAVARELRNDPEAAGTKIKWRVTLLKDPGTGAPTTYQIESSLHGTQGRRGRWHVERGAAGDPQATVYVLEATAGEAAIRLLRGDENVLFFIDRNGQPLVGNEHYSYTLNRRVH